MSPDFLPPARCDFSHARKGERPFQRSTLDKGRFPFLGWEKSHLAGAENRGSLISVPLALRERTRSPENFWTPPKELLVCSVVDFCTQKNRALTPEGGVENVPYEGGSKNPLLGGVSIREVFHPPLFYTPPWRPLWGVAKGSSVSWVAKLKGEKNSECKLSNGRSRSYKVIKLLLSAGK